MDPFCWRFILLHLVDQCTEMKYITAGKLPSKPNLHALQLKLHTEPNSLSALSKPIVKEYNV